MTVLGEVLLTLLTISALVTCGACAWVHSGSHSALYQLQQVGFQQTLTFSGGAFFNGDDLYQCMTVPGDGKAPVFPIVSQQCESAPTQQWSFQVASGRFTNQAGGLCLTHVNAAASLVGVTLCSPVYTGTQWFVWLADLTVRPNASSPLCIDVQGSRALNNAALVLANCSGAASQVWRSQDQAECAGYFPSITVAHLRQPYWLMGLSFCINIGLAMALANNGHQEDQSWGAMLKQLLKELVRLGLLGYQCLVVYITAQSTFNSTNDTGWGKYETFYFLVLNSSFPASVLLNFKPLFDSYLNRHAGCCKGCLGCLLFAVQCVLLLIFVLFFCHFSRPISPVVIIQLK
jgi:hypothetical protein